MLDAPLLRFQCDETGKRGNPPERCGLHKLPGMINIVGKPVFVPKKLVYSLVKFVLIAACIYVYTHTDRQPNDDCIIAHQDGRRSCVPAPAAADSLNDPGALENASM